MVRKQHSQNMWPQITITAHQLLNPSLALSGVNLTLECFRRVIIGHGERNHF